MKIKYKNQPPYSKMCGQTVLAMLLDLEIIDVCNFLKKHNKGTRNTDMYKILDFYKIKYRYKRCKYLNKIPNLAIVKIGFFDSATTHWVLKVNKYFYDPDIGIIKQYNKEFIEFISYIEINK